MNFPFLLDKASRFFRNTVARSVMAAARKERNHNPVLLKCPLIIRGSTGPAFQGKRHTQRSRGKGNAQSKLPDLAPRKSTDWVCSPNKKENRAKRNTALIVG
jgi:hypothetical protein